MEKTVNGLYANIILQIANLCYTCIGMFLCTICNISTMANRITRSYSSFALVQQVIANTYPLQRKGCFFDFCTLLQINSFCLHFRSGSFQQSLRLSFALYHRVSFSQKNAFDIFAEPDKLISLFVLAPKTGAMSHVSSGDGRSKVFTPKDMSFFGESTAEGLPQSAQAASSSMIKSIAPFALTHIMVRRTHTIYSIFEHGNRWFVQKSFVG